MLVRGAGGAGLRARRWCGDEYRGPLGYGGEGTSNTFCLSSRTRHTRYWRDWSSDVCSSDLELLSPPPAPTSLRAGRCTRVLLIDATRLRQPGGTGDDWRLHTAYDMVAGRLTHVTLTDRHTAESLAHYALQPGDIIVADGGYGYRRSVATVVRQQADGVFRIHPSTFPMEDALGQQIGRASCRERV